MASIATAAACAFFRDGRCTLVTYVGAPQAGVPCSLHAVDHRDCEIFKERPRGHG
jgi:hypothetical protein